MTMEWIAQEVCSSLCEARQKTKICSPSLPCWKLQGGGCPFTKRLFSYIKNGFVDIDTSYLTKKVDLLKSLTLSNLAIHLLENADTFFDPKANEQELIKWKQSRTYLFNTMIFLINKNTEPNSSSNSFDKDIRN